MVLNTICQHFLTKTCFPTNISYSSVNFYWSAHFNHQKFDDRPLFKPGQLWFSTILNIFCYHPNLNNTFLTFMKKKNYCAFWKKFPFIHWMTPEYIASAYLLLEVRKSGLRNQISEVDKIKYFNQLLLKIHTPL